MNRGDRLVADRPQGQGESYVERRHRTLTELKRTVQRHPAIDFVHGIQRDDGRFRELDVSLSPLILEIDADDAGLRIAWGPRPDPSELAYFMFHYHDSTGLDFDWYRDPIRTWMDLNTIKNGIHRAQITSIERHPWSRRHRSRSSGMSSGASNNTQPADFLYDRTQVNCFSPARSTPQYTGMTLRRIGMLLVTNSRLAALGTAQIV